MESTPKNPQVTNKTSDGYGIYEGTTVRLFKKGGENYLCYVPTTPTENDKTRYRTALYQFCDNKGKMSGIPFVFEW